MAAASCRPTRIVRTMPVWSVRRAAIRISSSRRQPTEYLKQIYFDSLIFTPEAIRHLAAQVGAGQIVLGSDYPLSLAAAAGRPYFRVGLALRRPQGRHPWPHRGKIVQFDRVTSANLERPFRRSRMKMPVGIFCVRYLLWGKVEDGRGSLGPMANAPFPIPARQTGRADFRHPAFRLASPRGTRRQTNRTRLRHDE